MLTNGSSQAGRLVLAGQRGQRAVQEPGTAKPDAD